MRLFLRQHCLLTITTVLCFAGLGCEESVDNNATRQALNALLVDLDAAVSKNNQEELAKVLQDTKKLQTNSQAQTKSKNLILATANEKLARLHYQTLSASLNSTKAMLQNISSQATQIAQIRGTASSFYQAGQPSGTIDLGQQIQLVAEQSRLVHTDNVSKATSSIASNKIESDAARTRALELSEAAETLFLEAETQGLIEGHKSFKQGVKTVRKSQKYDNSAESIEIESTLLTQRLLDDARAELEAITSILNGLENTNDVLEQIRNASMKNAAALRQFADELDNEAAQRMHEALEITNNVTGQLDAVTTNIQNSIQAVSRSGGKSRDARKTMSTWKLGLEWLLGQIEESKCTLLIEERKTISMLIHNNIVTSSNKWLALGDTLDTKIDQATSRAIAAYENAKGLANNLGKKSESLSTQFDTRISILQGNPIPQPAVTYKDESSAQSAHSNSTNTTSGFATPQDLITAFNAMPPFERNDGTAPAPTLTTYFEGGDANGTKMLRLMQKMATSSANLAIAVRTHIGAQAIKEMLASLPQTPGGGLKSNLNTGTLVMLGDNNATITDESGKSMQLQKTQQGWKIIMGASMSATPEAAQVAMMMLEAFEKMGGMMDMLTNQVNSGQITSMDQLYEAMATSSSMGF